MSVREVFGIEIIEFSHKRESSHGFTENCYPTFKKEFNQF